MTSEKDPPSELKQQPNKRSWILPSLGGLAVGVIGFAILHFLIMGGPTNTLEFCVSCHEMDGVYEEYKESTHYKNTSGVRVVCSDCHVPHGKGFFDYLEKLEDKVIVGGRHLYHHLIGTYPDRESFEKSRYRLAQYVLTNMRERDSKECRQCHTYEAMQFLDQGKSAANKHKREHKSGTKTCIDCHSGLVHEEPDEPDEEE
ncbi:MAG: NapC/NirT family cytochrome c [Magnetococcales bacterium]|nr:NapC/NirT family cytochrome c [Magnetococcales bacterium]